MKIIGNVVLSLLLSSSIYAGQKSICGTDDRVPSSLPKIGRLLGKMTDGGGCTVTMIGKTCAISAGHCDATFGFAEFNTPPSIGGRIQHPESRDIYPVDKANSVWNYSGIGDDWAVLKVLPNTETGLYAGDVQGYYNVDFNGPKAGDLIRITGYGLDRSDPERNLAQQTHTGEVVRLRGSAMYHIADTMGGNSGSSIIRESDEMIVGIHTNGGCYSRGGSNSATVISENQELVKAIRACLAEEALLSY
ncbi:MAG: trypsin-like serine protease [Bdellovibrionota bacterium]|jgi:V8-like Glu-specific endopeptidase|nr:trypsin-like serine protease [Bdellovibrionota bacterium]